MISEESIKICPSGFNFLVFVKWSSFNVPKYRFHSLIIKWYQIYFQDYQSPSQEYFEEYFSILVGYRLLLHLEKYQWNKPQDFVCKYKYGFLLHNLHREFPLAGWAFLLQFWHFIISTK
jgi:hypothetical protein